MTSAQANSGSAAARPSPPSPPASVATGPAPAPELGDNCLATADRHVVDAAAAVADPFSRRRDQDIVRQDRRDERDVGARGDSYRALAIAGAGEGAVGQHEHVATVRDPVTI